MSWYFTLLIFILGCDQQHITDNSLYTSQLGYHQEALAFCTENNLNTSFYYLVDFRFHSGKKRFFVYDFNQREVIQSGLVTHGACDVFESNPAKYQTAKFSNQTNSHCSSIGKYKIGARDYSSWGINVKYWIHGLDETNSNAKERIVVLHSWSAVDDDEIFPNYAPLSWGCPAVSDNFMRQLDTQLKSTSKPVLLWIIGNE